MPGPTRPNSTKQDGDAADNGWIAHLTTVIIK